MTWSIVHDLTFDLNADRSSAWSWYFNTYLPTKGFVVSPNESGGRTQNGNELWTGFEKTYANGPANNGLPYTHRWIVELEYTQGDYLAYSWDGVPGSPGTNVTIANQGSYNIYLPNSAATTRWIIMETDQDPEGFLVFVDGNLLAKHNGTQVYWPNVNTDRIFNSVSYAAYSSGTPYLGDPNNSASLSYQGGHIAGYNSGYLNGDYQLISTQFSGPLATSTVGMFDQDDIAMRMGGSNVHYGNVRCRDYGCSTFTIDGDYWLDLVPGANASFLFKTGANNYNNLFSYTGMPT